MERDKEAELGAADLAPGRKIGRRTRHAASCGGRRLALERPAASLPIHERSWSCDPGDGAPAPAAFARQRLRRLRRAVRGPRGGALPRQRDVHPGAGLAEPGLPRRALADSRLRHVGNDGEGDRHVPRHDRLRRTARLAGLRARLDPRPALLGERLRDRRCPGRPGPRLHRFAQDPRHQPHQPRKPSLHSRRRAPR